MNLYELKQILAQSKHPSAPHLYAEVCNHIDHFVNSDGDPERVFLVEQFALFTLLNETTYDVYGRLRRLEDHSLDNYIERSRFYESACLTDEQLKDAYDAIADLWEDNEREHMHRSDGGFWSTRCALIKALYSILLDLEGDKDSLDEKLHALLSKHSYDELKIITEDYYATR